jgi:hypothetical protein
LFAPVVSDIEIVKDVAGYGIYWPAMGINTLGTLNPGKAYYVLSSANMEITFGDCAKGYTPGTLTVRQLADLSGLSPWELSNPTSSSHTIALLPEAIKDILEGSVIGAFDLNGNCFGIVPLNGEENCLTIFGDDELTTEKDGFYTEDQIIFKLYLPSTKEEMELLPYYDFTLPNADGLFTENGLSAITNFKESTGISETTHLHSVNIFPNPSSGKIFIEGFVPGSTITIMDMHGQEVFEKTLHENDVQQIGLEHLDPGAYMVIIKNSLNTSSHKLILK